MDPGSLAQACPKRVELDTATCIMGLEAMNKAEKPQRVIVRFAMEVGKKAAEGSGTAGAPNGPW